MKLRNLWLVVCGAMMIAGKCFPADKPAPLANFNCQTGIVYKTVNGESLVLDLYLPKTKKYENAPLIVYIHGGGWEKGDQKGIFPRETLGILLENGIACASVQYRLVRAGLSTAYDCTVDCKDAARFLFKHAGEYGIDSDRMGTWGMSAGGHLCLMTALAPDELFPGAPELQGSVPHFRCVASFFPVTTFTVPEILAGAHFNSDKVIRMFGEPNEQNKDMAKKLSPVEYLNPASPPILFLHGDKDQAVPYINSTYALDIAKQKGIEASLVTVTNGMHVFHPFADKEIRPPIEEISRIAADFLIEKVTKK